jgi:hypothetical protein
MRFDDRAPRAALVPGKVVKLEALCATREWWSTHPVESSLVVSGKATFYAVSSKTWRLAAAASRCSPERLVQARRPWPAPWRNAPAGEVSSQPARAPEVRRRRASSLDIGRRRTLRLRVSSSGTSANAPRPLLLWFHGGGDADNVYRFTSLRGKAESFALGSADPFERPGFDSSPECQLDPYPTSSVPIFLISRAL